MSILEWGRDAWRTWIGWQRASTYGIVKHGNARLASCVEQKNNNNNDSSKDNAWRGYQVRHSPKFWANWSFFSKLYLLLLQHLSHCDQVLVRNSPANCLFTIQLISDYATSKSTYLGNHTYGVKISKWDYVVASQTWIRAWGAELFVRERLCELCRYDDHVIKTRESSGGRDIYRLAQYSIASKDKEIFWRAPGRCGEDRMLWFSG